jgi:DNA modification methylase
LRTTFGTLRGGLMLETRLISDLIPYDRNPRDNADAVDHVLESLRLHGQVKHIVLSAVGHPFAQEIICCGHTTMQALKKFGATEAKVIVKSFDSEAEFVDYNIRDNKTSEFAKWNESELVNLCSEFELDLEGMGFDPDELCGSESKEGLTDEDDVPEVPAEPVAKLGQMWKLGDHKLLCGDSTDREQVERLMDGDRGGICITSPPYNVGGSVDNKKGHKKMYINSDDDIDDYAGFLNNFTTVSLCFVDYSFINIQGLSNNTKDIFKYVGQMVRHLKDVLIWNKSHAPPNIQKGSFGTKFEYVFCFARDDFSGRNFPCKWQGKYFNVIECETNAGQQESEDHRAGYPIAFPLWIIEKMDFAKMVYDPFGGTGTTLIACEKTGRKCRMMELDPKYCDVIIKRWQNFTGKKAELINE